MSCVQMLVNELHSLEWLGILLTRVAVGLLFSFRARETFCLRAPRTDAPDIDRSTYSFSRFQYFPRFDRGICLRLAARHRRTDSSGLRAARLRNDHGHCHDSDSKYQG